MVQSRYILRDPTGCFDLDAKYPGVQVVRVSDGAHFLAAPLPTDVCVDRTPTHIKGKLDSDEEEGKDPTSDADGDKDIDMIDVPLGKLAKMRQDNLRKKAANTETTCFDDNGRPVLWDDNGNPVLDPNGKTTFLDSTGKEVWFGVTRDENKRPVPPYAECFFWKQGKQPREGDEGNEEDKVYVRDMLMRDFGMQQELRLATAILPQAAVTMSRILNHPNIVSLVDIIDKSSNLADMEHAGTYTDITVWEDMNAGCLADLLPKKLPDDAADPEWQLFAEYNPHRFSLPESLCWHVLKSISRALLWLHFGVKETAGIADDWNLHDDDWMPILIRDVSPEQIFFKKSKGEETYGECKLGGFRWAKVASNRLVPLVPPPHGIDAERVHYWAPEIYNGRNAWERPSEVWSLGAVIYCMMTGNPPPRNIEYSWVMSRMNDRGYSMGLREIVADMLVDEKAKRPQARGVVARAEGEMRRWRVQTRDGREFHDIRDEEIEKAMRGGGRKLII